MNEKKQKPWWALGFFDILWWVGASIFLFRHSGAPDGITDWVTWFACACIGWFGAGFLWHVISSRRKRKGSM